MAAAADLLPPLGKSSAMRKGRKEDDVVRAKQNQSLDIALLCNKLEAHKREQDALKVRQNQRNAIRASYVPRNAARQFAMTATPLKNNYSSSDATKRTAAAPADLDDAPRLWTVPSSTARSCMNPKQLYAALNSGMSENEAAVSATASDAISRRPTSPRQRTRQGKHRSRSPSPALPQRNNATTRDPAESHDHPLRLSQDAERPLHQAYKPGDAARRRSVCANITFDVVHTTAAKIPHSTLPDDPRSTKTAAPLFDFSFLGEDERHTASAHGNRPKLVPADRPNWAQISQCGDDMRHTLHLPRFGAHRSKEDADSAATKAALATSDPGLRNQHPAHPHSSSTSARHQSESLIADAVRQIKKEEKLRRRDSIIGFFKRS